MMAILPRQLTRVCPSPQAQRAGTTSSVEFLRRLVLARWSGRQGLACDEHIASGVVDTQGAPVAEIVDESRRVVCRYPWRSGIG